MRSSKQKIPMIMDVEKKEYQSHEILSQRNIESEKYQLAKNKDGELIQLGSD
jgi:hypothetical protein